MPENLRITSAMLWQGAGLFALIDVPLLLLVAWLATPERFERLPRWLPATTALYYAALWLWVVVVFWDTIYRYVFPEWSRWLLPPAQGLLTGAISLLALLVVRRAGRWRPLLYCLLGGVWGSLSHGWAVYRGIVSAPPALAGASPVGAVTIAFFEFTSYWCVIVLATLALESAWRRVRPELAGRLGPGAALLALLLVGTYSVVLRTSAPPEPRSLPRDTLTVAGALRTYRIYSPPDRGDGSPIVLLLHGAGSSSQGLRAGSGYAFEQLAAQHGFIVVYPDGYEGHWNDCRARSPFSARRENIDDVGFLRALVAKVREREGAGSRVYAAGVANGGHLAFRLALEAPDLVTAVAAFAASLPVDAEMACIPTGQPVPVMIIHGTRDPISPFRGGMVSLFGFARRGRVRSAEATADYFAALLPGRSGPVVSRLPDRDANRNTWVERKTWQSADSLRVVLVTVVGGGHTIPELRARVARFFGATSTEMDGPREVWEFFASHASPRTPESYR